MKRFNRWFVILDNKIIDEVYFMTDCDSNYVLRSLIDHDCYNPRIKIKQAT